MARRPAFQHRTHCVLLLKEGKAVRLLTRNGNDLADRFPETVKSAQPLKDDLAIDGELVVADEHRHPSFYQYACGPFPSHRPLFAG